MTSRRAGFAVLVACALALPAVARANGLNLSWDACGTAGVANKQFACSYNYWSEHLVLSAEFPMEWVVDLPLTFDATLEVAGAPSALPDWWRLGPGECRA